VGRAFESCGGRVVGWKGTQRKSGQGSEKRSSVANLTWKKRYINFGHGDESLEEIYGKSLPRLRELKRKWDPQNRFNQWFNIQ
jgi:FAD/FMN-containing dehydrogenase